MFTFVKLAIASLLVSVSVTSLNTQKRDISNLPRSDISNFPSNNPRFPGNKPNFPSNNPSFPGNNPSFPGNNPSFPGNKPSFPTNGGIDNFPDMDGILDRLPDIRNIMEKFRNNPNLDSSNYHSVMDALLKDPKYQSFLKEFNPQSPNDISLEDLDKILNRISNNQNGGSQNPPRVLTSNSSKSVVAIRSVVMVTVMSLFMLL